MVNRVALPIIREARSGNPAAQLALGRVYLEGRDGLRRDETAAYYWLQKAAANGVSEAARLIGAEISEASVTDPASAAPLYEQASRSGVTNASLTLADWILAGIVERGSGTTAFDLILQTAEQGDRRAQLRLAMFYQNGGDLVLADGRRRRSARGCDRHAAQLLIGPRQEKFSSRTGTAGCPFFLALLPCPG